MQEKEKMTPISDILLLADNKSINKIYVDIINEEEIPILCINKAANKKRLMPFKVLHHNNDHFWQQGSGWEYFLAEKGFEKLKEKAIIKTGVWEFDRPKTEEKAEENVEVEEELEELEVEVGYGSEYNTFSGMSTAEKIDYLNQNKKQLNDLLLYKTRDKRAVAETLVSTAKDVALVNHAILEEVFHFTDDEAKKVTQGLVDSTHEMIKSSVQLISEEVHNNELLLDLANKSNGTILQHITRVFFNGVDFLKNYNNLVSTSSAIQKLRISFASKYRKYYHSLLPHLNVDDVILERVYLGGMRAIPPDMLFKWSVGFLIHDIGKAAAVEYHEGESAYDRNIVIDHVKTGYHFIVSKTNYSREASLITGYHHEYYGDPAGYGYFRSYLQHYKKQNVNAKQDYCITYELEPMMDYKALAYFPAKVLEIIDVFDSITDPCRVYRKPLTPEEALVMMREEFIDKHVKIDPILFDIFVTFIQEKQKNQVPA
jgi:HD-GYP domain-containing protein (c-di-GMP phosphodiesterase class II)